jgi:hypothetical protein
MSNELGFEFGRCRTKAVSEWFISLFKCQGDLGVEVMGNDLAMSCMLCSGSQEERWLRMKTGVGLPEKGVEVMVS